MPDLPPRWATDLAVLELSGSTVERHPDHVVVRTPQNPNYHWGNCLFVTSADATDDADRWVETFRLAHPDATWTAIGLSRMPTDRDAWAAYGLELEVDDVLTTRLVPREAPLTPGYTVRELAGRDWELSLAREIAENERTGYEDAESFARFAEGRMAERRTLAGRGVAAFFGAFAADALVAELGIVDCGGTARYQAVGTDEAHRKRGLASHLLGVAARWAAERGADQWVIVTEATNPAGRVYRAAGFRPDVGSVQAYRRPPR